MEYVGAKPLRFWFCVLAVGGLAISAFGPWVDVVFASRNGLDYGDGWLVLGCSMIAGVGLARFAVGRMKGLIGVIVGGLGAFATAAYDWHHIQSDTVASAGWGVQLAAVAAAIAVIDAIVLAVRTPRHGLVAVPANAGARRDCPHCKESMRRDASTCPHCRKESPAWRFHEGAWWMAQPDGDWLRRDEATGAWTRWKETEDGADVVETDAPPEFEPGS